LSAWPQDDTWRASFDSACLERGEQAGPLRALSLAVSALGARGRSASRVGRADGGMISPRSCSTSEKDG